MVNHPILEALDNPDEAAYRAERRRGRRRQLFVILGATGLILGYVGWKVFQHLAASAWLLGQQHKVEWKNEGKNGKWGGGTSVIFVPHWSLSNASQHGTDLRHVTWLYHVVELDVSGTLGLTDSDLVVLDQLTALKSLNLDRSRKVGWMMSENTARLTDVTLGRIRWLKNLESFDMAGQPITDAGLANLAGLTELKDLALRNTPITDAGLEHLKGLPNLRSLDLIGTKVTAEGIQKFEAAKPGLKILSDVEIPSPVKSVLPNR